VKLTILGYWGGYPSAGGATPGYLIQTDEGSILLDCGSGVMSRLGFYLGAEAVSGVVLSHLHFDHMADMGILQYAVIGALRTGLRSSSLPVYAPNEPSDIWNILQGTHSEFVSITSNMVVQLAGAEVTFHPVLHTIPCYAVKIACQGKNLVYSADTEYSESLIEFAKDADLFLCEATICKGSFHTTGKGHMDAGQAATIAKKANVKQLVLTHLPHDGNFEQMRREAMEVFGGTVYLPNFKSDFYI
jgi:ribonuclease BN (tRNA processing enzyme)